VHVRALVGERHPLSSPSALTRAGQYLADAFRRAGLDVSFHTFDALGGTYRNVIGVRPGAQPADPAWILAAHYDTVPGSPGADDNASGLAVMLEVAQALQASTLRAPVHFVGFCLEEEDLLGSRAYAAHLRAKQHGVSGAIVLECVGCCRSEAGSQQVPPGVPIAVPTTGDFLAIVGNAASRVIVEGLEQAATRRVPELKTVPLLVPGNGEMLPDIRRSDHAAFWDAGYPAVMLTDTANFRNPHYHRPTDTEETLDFLFMERVVQALTVALQQLAGTSSS
jgi:Zn-dependent M28 family amino/carboxypeptidase